MSRGFKAIQVVVVCSLLLFLVVPIQSQQVAERADNQIIVKLKPGIQSTDIDAIQRSLNASVIRHFRLIGAELWKISGVTVEDAIARYASDPRIEYIEPDYIVHALEVIPNDPSFNLLWGLHNTGQSGGTPDADIDAPEAWEIATGDDVVLGVIDTGVDWSHADLSSNIWTNPGEIPDNGVDDDGNGYIDDVRGWDFVNNDNNPTDDNGHGTHVSGTIAAVGNNGIGVVGVSWSAKIMPLKFLDYSGGGYTSDAILAVEYATMMGARFTNNSWGGGGFSSALRDAIEASGNAGMLFIAAAGNSGDDNDMVPHYPSSYDLDNIIAVAATDHNDVLADFSCYGATSVDLAAPGVNIYSCLPGGSYGYSSGTSMATPQVSGAVSLFWSHYPSTPHLNVKERVFASVDVLPALVGSMVTGGRLNAFKMISEPDATPPGAVSDLGTTNPTSNAITLTWTATGDDTTSGTASSYDIRYSLSPIDDGNFDLANQVAGEPHPQVAGSPETFTVPGLDFSTTYYFAVKAFDEWGNPSPVSNSPSGTTLGVPHIAVSPDALSEDLLTGATSTQNLTIENTEPNTTLDFCISIEATEEVATRVDVIGGKSLGSVVVAKGRPLSAKELENLRASVLQRINVPVSGAIDKGTQSKRVTSRVGALERLAGEEVFGSMQNQYFSGPRTRGNLFTCTESTSLIEHRLYLNPSASTQLWFLVYEGESQVGVYNLVSASDVSPAGPGEGWYSSGDVNVSLEAGKYYLIVASFEQESYYYNEQGISPYPIPASFGELTAGAGFSWAPSSSFPPDPIQDVPGETFGEPVAYYQTLVTGVGTSWLSVAPECGTVPGASSMNVEVTFDAAGLDGGDYFANIVVASNDSNNPEVIVPATLHVTGAPDIAVVPAAMDYGPVFIGGTKLDTLVISNEGTDILSVTGMVLDNADFSADLTPFDLSPHESRDLVVAFAPSTVGAIPGTLTITTNDPDEGTVVVQLGGEGLLPPVVICPPSDTLSKDLFTGETWDTVLTLCNTGQSDLNYCISVEGADAAAARGKVALGIRLRAGNGDIPDGSRDITPAGIGRAPAAVGPSYSGGRVGSRNRDIETSAKAKVMASDLKILLLHSAAVSEISDLLLAFPDISVVDVFDGSTATPTLATLAGYDAVILINDTAYLDPVGIGDVLADYVDAGGGVIMTLASFIAGWDVGGRFASGGYYPFTLGSGPIAGATLANFDPNHPIMAGVTTAWGDLLGDIDLSAGAEWVADWDNGEPFIATQGERVAAVNIFLSDGGYWTGDIPLILHNAVLWSAGTSWLTVAPECGTVPPNSCADITVTFDAADLYGGDYYADLAITENDPVTPECRVPAHLHVTGAPDIAVASPAIDYGPVFIGGTKLDTVVISNEGTDVLSVSEMVLDNADFSADLTPFDLAPKASRELAVAFAPSVVGLREGTLTITSNDPDEGTVVVGLRGEGVLPPEMVCPPSDTLSKDLFTGETKDTVITLCNDGETELSYCILVEETAGPVSAGPAARAGSAPKRAQLGSGLGTSTLAPQPKSVDREPRALQAWETPGDRRDLTFAPGKKAQESTSSVIFEDGFEDGDYDDWVDTGMGGMKEVTSATAAKGVYSFHQYASPGGHWSGIYHDFGAIQPGYISFYMRSGSTSTNTAYFVLRDSQGYDVIWFFAYDDGLLYVNDDVGGDHTYPYTANTWYHIQFKDIDFVSQTFDYYVDEALVKADIPFRNAYAVNDFYRLDLYNWSVGSQGWWDEIQIATEEPARWLRTNPVCGAVPPNSCMDITVTFDAADMYGGDYYADLVITGNDPVTPECRVPAHLHVTGAPDIAVAPTAIDYGPLFIGATKLDTLVISNEGTDVLHVSEMTLDNADFSADLAPFDLAPEGSREFAVAFAPSVAGLREGTLAITSDDPDEGVVEVALRGEGVLPPVMVCPPSDTLSRDLFTGGTWDTVLTLCNEGESELTFSMSGEEATAPTRMSVDEAIASIVGRSGVLKGELRMKSARAISPGETVERVYRSAGDVANVKLGRAAGPSVLLLAADLPSFVQDVQDKLLATGTVGSVAFIDASVVTPTLAELQAFDAVMVWSDYSYADNVTLGNNMADYVDGGGGVVSAIFEVASGAYPNLLNLSGRWEAEQYHIVVRSDPSFFDPATLGVVAEPNHPIMEGVSSFDGGPASLRPTTAALTSGSTLIASWSDGIPLVAVKEIARGKRVDLGFFPPSSDMDPPLWQVGTDGDHLMANALAWAASGVRWLSVAPNQGAVAPHSCMDITVTFDAADMYGGDYYADLVITGNDPVTPECRVPAHLHVTGAPDIAVVPTAIDYGPLFIGATKLDTLVISNEGTDVLHVSEMTLDNADFSADLAPFDLAPEGSRELAVTFAPSVAGLREGTLAITSDDPDEGIVVVGLRGEGVLPPVMVCPPSDTLSKDLFTGGTWDTVLTLCNDGESELTFSISGEEATAPTRMSVDEAIASIVGRSGVLKGELRMKSARAVSPGETVERVYRSAGDVANVKLGRAAGPSVALVAADMGSWVQDVQDKLLATGTVGSVAFIDASVVTPTLAELQAFDAVMVWSDFYYADNVTLGNNMADYVDGGGGVVSALCEVALDVNPNPLNMSGRWESEQYYVVLRSGIQAENHATLGAVADPGHPIMAGVSSFDGGSGSYRPTTTDLTNGSTLIASWSDGIPLVAVKNIGGARRVDLGFFPVSSDMDSYFWLVGTDGDHLMANALAWVAGGVRWLSAEPSQGAVPPNSCIDITVTFDATDMYGGDYYADLVITGNDPVTPECRVPAHLHVTGAPDIAVVPTAIDYGPLFIGATKLDTLVISNEGTDVLSVSEMTLLFNTDFSADLTPFDLAPDESRSLAVAFTPTAAGLREGILAIMSNDPDEDTVMVELRGEGVLPPVMVCPPSDTLSKDLFTGGTWDTVLTLCNDGESELTFSISGEEEATAPTRMSVDEAIASIVGRSGVLKGELRMKSARAISPGEPVERVYRSAGDVANVKLGRAAGPSVALVAADMGSWVQDVQDKLLATGTVGSVALIDASVVTPTLAELQAFDAVMVWSDAYYADNVTLGNNMADYVDGGGGVVCAIFEVASMPFPNSCYLSGRWESEQYYLVERSGFQSGGPITLGAVAEPGHPIMAGVSSFNGGPLSVRPTTADLASGSTLIASWSDGIPLVVVKEMARARRVDLGLFPPSSDADSLLWQVGTDGDHLMANALAWAAGRARWLSAAPNQGAVAPHSCMDITVTFDAADMYGGDYYADLVITGNDPLTPECRVPAHLHVTGAPDIAVSDTVMDYGPLFIGATKVDTLVISNGGTDVLHVSELALDNADFSVDVTPFDVAPEESRSLGVVFAPTVAGLREGMLTITSDDPDEGVVEVELRGEGVLPPEMVCPPSDTLSKDLFTGGTWDTVLTLCNEGEGELEFSISSEDATAPIRMRVNEAIASIVGRSGVLKGEIRIKSANLAASGEAIERVYRNPGDVAHVKLGPAAGPSMLLLAAEIPSFAQDVQDKLLATGKVGSVTFIDVGLMTPTLAELQAFDAVMVWSDYPYADNVTLGNNLADYVDSGGGVVCGMFEVANMPGPSSYYLGGRWESEQYYVFLRDQFQSGYASMLGAVAEPAHPVMEGVTSFYGGSFSFHSSTATLTSGSTLIASWSDGVPLVAVKEIGRARRVDLDFFPVSSDANPGYWQVGTDGDLFMANALAWVARGGQWLSAEPSQGVVAPNSCMDITVTFDAVGLQNGDYYANLVIAGNDPVTPECRVPAHLSIQGNGSSMILLTGCGSGWYLKSWNVDTPVDSTTVVLKDIMSCLAVALGYDGGGLSYYPSIPPQFNTLKTMDHLHGYWFRMACDDILVVQGTPVSIETPIPLSAGWNVASYLPAEADSTVHALGSIVNNVSVVLGFECGGLSYYPSIPPQFNTLQVMKPTCGYWIKMGTADTLIYPETVVYESPPVATAMMLGGEGYGGDAVSKVLPTREWINVWGEGVRMDGTSLRVGTIVKAVDEDGVVCGQCAVRSAGDFGLMAIYKDDPETEVDEGAEAGETVTLYLGDVKVSGGIRWTELGDCVNFKEAFSLADGNVETLPAQYALLQNYPNPFNPTTSIRYELPRDSYVELVIYNVQGQVVRELVKGMQKAQRYVVAWDGKNAQGSSVSSGIYFYRIKAGEFVNTKKMVLLR